MIKIIIFIFATTSLFAQNRYLNDTVLNIKDLSDFRFNPTSKGFYQKYISSQDGSVCTFYPSCSVFSRMVIKKRGLIWGICLTADRICRCNGKHHDLYDFSVYHQKPIDFP
ncbi:MAG: membrane protein insertion efficiency factor YidD [Bacteroidota bacterium]|jgi:putative component of membrane protein insertase Oxa1/YidC/SpoIIIJ protein YidD